MTVIAPLSVAFPGSAQEHATTPSTTTPTRFSARNRRLPVSQDKVRRARLQGSSRSLSPGKRSIGLASRMASTIERSKVSSWLREFLETELNMPVGRVIAPDNAGWQTDSSKPGAEFIPYIVLTPGTSTPTNPVFSDSSQDWNSPYQATIYGVDVDQVEEVADAARSLLLKTKKVSVVMSEGNWRITTISCTAIGGVGYTTAIDPTAYSQTDSFTLSLSRSIS